MVWVAWTACRREGAEARPDRVPSPPPVTLAPPQPPPRPAVEVRAERCNPVRPLDIATGWRAVGWRPGPEMRDVLATGPRRRQLMATTRETVCVTRDDGRTWTSPFPPDARLASPQVHRLERSDALLLIAQGTVEAPTRPRVMLSRDEGVRWADLALPAAAGDAARVFTDGARKVYVASPTQLWASEDLHAFGAPVTLPGESADRVDVCGRVMIARARVGSDYFHHRSEDFGQSWRAFRLGAIGLEGNEIRVRCLGWRGGIEAGYDPLPRSWTFDGGHAWEAADYDAKARTAARAMSEVPPDEAVIPRCVTTPAGARMCLDSGRARVGDREVHAPGGCERMRAIDDRRLIAFGASCGSFVSTDLGGVWRPMSTSLRAQGSAPAGAGGFISRDVAWRVAGGVWWTHDGGAHWRLAPTVQGRTIVRGVFVDTERGVFVRDDGWVLSTRDGGRTWSFVTRGEGVRVTSARDWVMVTTAERARASSDGGATWRANAAIPPSIPLDPGLVVAGAVRRIDPAPGVRVQQSGDRVEVQSGGESQTLVRALPERFELLAAHADARGVDRVMLSDGVILHRAPRGRRDASARASADASQDSSDEMN